MTGSTASSSFNEAAALRPQKGSGLTRCLLLAVSSFNEAAALRPQKGPAGFGDVHRSVHASMRLRH